MNEIHCFRNEALDERQALAVFELIHTIWPTEGKTPEMITADWAAGRLYGPEDPRPDFIRYIIFDGDQVVAHASTFRREVIAGGEPLTVLALAGVCVEGKRQGEGMGVAIVKRAFQVVDDRSFPVSLFQTDVTGFYLKLGCRSVSNRFVNSKSVAEPKKNPWWGEDVMIYPTDCDWPDGEIDLRGPGY